MTSPKVLSQEAIASCRHPKRKYFFVLAALPMLILIGLLFAMTLDHDNAIVEMDQWATREYLSTQFEKGTPDTEILGHWDFSGTTAMDPIVFRQDHTISQVHSGGIYQSWSIFGNTLILRGIVPGPTPTIREDAYTITMLSLTTLTLTSGDRVLHGDRNMVASQSILTPLGYEERSLGGLMDCFRSWGRWYYLILALLGGALFFSYFIYAEYIKAQSYGIRIQPNQFPRSYALFAAMAAELGLTHTPELYLKNGNGIYNAFATCIPGYRSFAVIHAEIFQAYENGGDEGVFRFVVGHELGHLRLGHISPWLSMLTFVGNLPFIRYVAGMPFTRASEYEADQIGRLLSDSESASHGLLMLISSNSLYRDINIDAYCEGCQHQSQIGHWLSNAQVDHPIIPWRIDTLRSSKVGGIFFHSLAKK